MNLAYADHEIQTRDKVGHVPNRGISCRSRVNEFEAGIWGDGTWMYYAWVIVAFLFGDAFVVARTAIVDA